MGFANKFITGLQGFLAAFQSPGQPQQPAMPKGTPPARMDYASGINLNTHPKADSEITFEDLRSLADNYDLLRLAIEKRKDQIEAVEWNVAATDKSDPVMREKAAELYRRFRRPDGVITFSRWLRALVEESLVIDAPSIYMRRNLLGDIIAFELVDGATIKVNIDAEGRTPKPPEAAYQQIIEGMPAVDLTTDDILYCPRNVRTNKLYGYSKVEQIIMTVNLAIRRQLYQLDYYTEGNIPEAFIACPADWGLEQIVAFQEYWDDLFAKNRSLQRRARFVPAGSQPVFSKDNPLKDEFDEWLGRIISYALDLPPTALVKETNRATAETTQDASQSEGAKSMLNYLKEIMDTIIQDYLGYEGIEFVFGAKEDVDPLKQAQINNIYVNLRVLAPSEIRSNLGYDPMTPEQEKEFASLPAPMAATSNPLPGGANKVQKVDKSPAADKEQLEAAQQKFSKVLRRFFDQVKKPLANQVAEKFSAAMSSVEKLDAKTRKKIIDMTLDELDYDGWSMLWGDAADCLGDIAKAGAYEALGQVGVSSKDITKLVDKNAVNWADKRAAELVGKKWDGDQLLDNPNPRWAITDSTREYLRGTVGSAVDEGWSPQKLASSIKNDDNIWKDRADMISRTELQFAHQNGNLIGWKGSGVVKGKKSFCLHDDSANKDDPCIMNAEAGTIDIDDDFPSGDAAPPYHPNCVCTMLPVLDEDMPDG